MQSVTKLIPLSYLNLVTPKAGAKCELLFNKPVSEAGLLNKSSCLAPALVVTKFTTVRDMTLVKLCCATQVGLACSKNPPHAQWRNTHWVKRTRVWESYISVVKMKCVSVSQELSSRLALTRCPGSALGSKALKHLKNDIRGDIFTTQIKSS